MGCIVAWRGGHLSGLINQSATGLGPATLNLGHPKVSGYDFLFFCFFFALVIFLNYLPLMKTGET